MSRLRTPSRKAILSGLILLSLLLMFLENIGQAKLIQGFSHLLRPILAPLGSATVYLTSQVSPAPAMSEDRQQVQMGSTLVQMKQIIADQQQQIGELRHWRETLDGFDCMLLDGHVIGGDGNPLRDRRLLDVGSKKGVREGDLVTTRQMVTSYHSALPKRLAVVGTNYLVGIVTDSAAYSATVQLVSDPHFYMPAIVFRMLQPGEHRDLYVTDAEGLKKQTLTHDGSTPSAYPIGEPISVTAEGDGRQIVLRGVKAQHNIQKGDLLTTGPATANMLPFGLTIGRVTGYQNEAKDAHFVTVYVEPLADLNHVDNVYVLLPPSRGTK